MPVDSKAFEQAFEIQREFEERFSDVKEVLGIGLCLNKAANAPAISVQVSKKIVGARLPPSFHGLDVVIDVVGEIKAL